jgi:hypothetical protein
LRRDSTGRRGTPAIGAVAAVIMGWEESVMPAG